MKANKIDKQIIDAEIGMIRNFTFKGDKHFTVREVLTLPDIKMNWNWGTGVCPHCKKKLQNSIEHTFYKVEILTDKDVEDNAYFEIFPAVPVVVASTVISTAY